ncbi:hypothetical protein [Trinickia soli]|uniref:hypothetical protein n=1 Tax=Trinickia soli TaxID=380675 RepID=UPI003FA381B9
MKSTDLRRSKFTELPYGNSGACTIFIHASSMSPDDLSTINLLAADGSENPGTFVFGLYPLNFGALTKFSLTYGDSSKGLVASQVQITSDVITLDYPDTVTNPQDIGLGLNIWWASDATSCGLQASSDVYATVNFNKSTQVLRDGNLIYFEF